MFTTNSFHYLKLMAPHFRSLAWTTHLPFELVYSPPPLEYLISITNYRVQNQSLKSLLLICPITDYGNLFFGYVKTLSHLRFLSFCHMSHPICHHIVSFLSSAISTINALLTFHHRFAHLRPTFLDRILVVAF